MSDYQFRPWETPNAPAAPYVAPTPQDHHDGHNDLVSATSPPRSPVIQHRWEPQWDEHHSRSSTLVSSSVINLVSPSIMNLVSPSIINLAHSPSLVDLTGSPTTLQATPHANRRVVEGHVIALSTRHALPGGGFAAAGTSASGLGAPINNGHNLFSPLPVRE
ncbi:hypothetical protein Ndes2526B_g01460 [Nannochloris sp. 'desiccata']|nr:hypothetical protein KSW81_004219 [Chlorella desiccata (nom. nud.)]KAH7624201.1 hypothetical protein NADE_009013 [Chlorella desiccata (nom. nud.)]